ncbi:MAG: hypothetical protein A3G33_05770 [Omnitrophica bacterium RIFCSPLOWO2_12_FULL_44_17]|uniref:Prepilin-type N-terminal cleavage/methylation domain-containing protein n=1 Tax=Candidatus Danuiimicrobium aquiferis TaxID=1801832 RepID=A0A1G1L3X9_9BACT|nr:MAG: hypothetical protein A3B72_08295 [Omnitrophica bacterium RIFCSPHIGHO2_02_FULL_45_28]OGW90505.1 MAG: hypothetical protein A3E74_07625 [Omnitrophica bacterium RIFCSPHIGHO2_12_FULL_44_12]OGW99579.1 MAG: hypothetical protein A3G33_05770 [Omnitrophica bacterium RIFCSPLOWO2_12_FULL_44_17]OGX03614.1 MAG: hypothetical protein A3J12_05525 [Omnitrophica bacterium RIFCSPLOWO2_02_FULL_44_11]
MKRDGFTLTELMVSIAIGTLALSILSVLYIKGLESSGGLGVESDIQHSARQALYQLSSQLKRGRDPAIPSSPNNTQISISLPVSQITAGSCSAHILSSISSIQISCTDTNACINACRSGTCFKLPGAPAGICEKQYTYSLSQANGVSQIMVTGANENPRIIGNGIQTLLFQDNSIDTNLRSGEIRIRTTAQMNSVQEKKTRQINLQTVVQIRN